MRKRKSDPIIDLSLLHNRTFAASILGGGLFYIGTTAQVFLMALLLQVGFGFSALPRRPDAARGRDRLDRDALHLPADAAASSDSAGC